MSERIVNHTGTSRFGKALDVACGTGMSTRALADIAERVDAVDRSAEMIAEAEPNDRIRYQTARAESLPFADNTFDLITVGLAFHWFDQAAFLHEARRVLKPDACLAVYNSGFSGEMVEDDTFKNWTKTEYPKRFPPPARNIARVDAESVEPYGFAFRDADPFTHLEPMTAGSLTRYLLTQSNVIAAVEDGSTPIDEAGAWITNAISPFFAGQTRTMKFVGSVWLLKRLQALKPFKGSPRRSP